MTETNATTHFHSETDDDNIVWLHFDKADAGTNVLNVEVLEQLDQHLQQIAAQGPRGLVILSDKANGFIAGADITAFTQLKTSDQALAFLRSGQDVFNRLEALPFPTVALIHGFCLGGGTELSLACRYRVTRDDPGTRMGLPEVKLGIHPGWGGRLSPNGTCVRRRANWYWNHRHHINPGGLTAYPIMFSSARCLHACSANRSQNERPETITRHPTR